MEEPIVEIAKLKANEINMSKQISDIKSDIKDVKNDIGGIKNDIVNLRMTIARWGGGITVGWVAIEVAINYLFKL